MPPPPRPPIICYDLQTNTNLRRAPCTRYRVPVASANRKTKVTVVNKNLNDLSGFTANTCWHHHGFENFDQDEGTENFTHSNIKTTTTIQERKQTTNKNDQHVRVVRRPRQHPELVQAEPYKFIKSPFAQHTTNDDHRHHHYHPHHGYQHQIDQTNRINNNNVRFAYGEKLRHEAERNERLREIRKTKLDWLNQIEDMSAQLESVKRNNEYLLKTCGMSHKVAKYISLQDEEIGKLKRKIDQCVDIRSRELAQRDRQLKRSHELQLLEDRKVEERRVRDMAQPIHSKRTLSSTLNNSLSSSSQDTNKSNTRSSSSTISISSSSSPMSLDEPHPSVHFVESPPTSIEKAPHLSSSTPSKKFLPKNFSSNNIISHKPPDFTFYKGNPLENQTIEVTDIDFFEKVEDKTMMEVNDLFNKIRTVRNDINHYIK